MQHDLDALIKQQSLSRRVSITEVFNIDPWHDMTSAPKDGTRFIVHSATTNKNYYAKWNDDKYARNPKPDWDVEGQTVPSAALCLDKWRYDVENPKP